MLAMRLPPLEAGPSPAAPAAAAPAAPEAGAEGAPAAVAAGTPAAGAQAAVQAATPTAQAPVQPFVILMDVRASAPNIRLPRSSGARPNFNSHLVGSSSTAWLHRCLPSGPCAAAIAIQLLILIPAPTCSLFFTCADSMDAIEADLGQLTLQTAGIMPQVGSAACRAQLHSWVPG